MESNQGLSAYQPNALPLGQTASPTLVIQLLLTGDPECTEAFFIFQLKNISKVCIIAMKYGERFLRDRSTTKGTNEPNDEMHDK